jgi:hypothetical protein
MKDWTDEIPKKSTAGKPSGWLYYREGSTDPQHFYSYAEEKWITLGTKKNPTQKEKEQQILDSVFAR